jgi:hypothetical protein
MAMRRSWGGTSRIRLTVMFLVVLLPPAVTLIWLGFRLLEQDRELEAQREIEIREAAADAIARSLSQSVNEAESWSPSGPLPDGAHGIIVNATGVRSHPAGRVLWMTPGPVLPEPPSQAFEEAELVEVQTPQAALAAYEKLARSTDLSMRAGALLRIARVDSERPTMKEKDKPIGAVFVNVRLSNATDVEDAEQFARSRRYRP